MHPREPIAPPRLGPARAPICLIAVALAIGLALGGCSGGSSSPASSSASSSAASDAVSSAGFDGAALPAGRPPREFTLKDLAGHAVTLSGYRGQVTILAFLYSTCGPTCVLIAQQIRGALDELPHPVPVLFVTADPAADTTARVNRFLARVSLAGRVRYLTGPRAALEPVWRAYGVIPASAGRTAFERSPSVILLDRSGGERVIFGLEQLTPEALAHDVRKLS
jgi:protein SCO1/2